eukprot:gene1988-2447_t
MDINQVLPQLVEIAFSTFRPEKEIRDKGYEQYLNFTKSEGTSIILLQIQEAQVDQRVKLFYAINFKNLVKQNWLPSSENPISQPEKDKIKSVLLQLLLNSNDKKTQDQLLEALAIIGGYEFPTGWPTLLPELIEKLGPNSSLEVINPVLKAINSIFKKYRHESNTPEIIKELIYILEIFPTRYLEILQSTSKLIDTTQDGKQLAELFKLILLQFEIFLSLSSVDLPEFFEVNLKVFVAEFIKFLKYQSNYPELVGNPEDEEPSLLNNVQKVICDILNLYAQLYDTEIADELQGLVVVVWELLSRTSNGIKNDHLVYSAIKFLATVSMSIKHDIFNSIETLKHICSFIVTPNIKLRDSDLELYEDQPTEYMNRDIEGSDSDTRRRAAIELVRGLRKYFDVQVTQLLEADIAQLLDHYQQNPTKNWLSKDSAIFLVTALAVKSEKPILQQIQQLTPQQLQEEAIIAEKKLMKTLEFFNKEIIPELMKPTNEQILKADCLKFITIFRNQIPASDYTRVLQIVVPKLSDPDYVVHTYASTCIDRLLITKDATGKPILSADFISSILPDLLLPLVKALSFPDSEHNERIMRPIVRIVLMMVSKIDINMTRQLLKTFTEILLKNAANPANHNFNHYCFEAVGSLLKSNPTDPDVFQIIIPLIEYVLAKDVAEFSPYTFQLLSILVENSTPQSISSFEKLIPNLYHPTMWKRPGNIPGLVRLFQAFFKKSGETIAKNNYLEPILGVFQQLVSSPVNDHEGFYLIESIVENLPLVILERISLIKTVQIINNVKPGLWDDIIIKLWVPTVNDVVGTVEKKILSISMTNLLVCQEFFASYQETWLKILECQYHLLTGKESAEKLQEEDPQQFYFDKEETNAEGYTPTFTQLHFSKKQDIDPFPQISDSKSYFANSFHKSNCNSNSNNNNDYRLIQLHQLESIKIESCGRGINHECKKKIDSLCPNLKIIHLKDKEYFEDYIQHNTIKIIHERYNMNVEHKPHAHIHAYPTSTLEEDDDLFLNDNDFEYVQKYNYSFKLLDRLNVKKLLISTSEDSITTLTIDHIENVLNCQSLKTIKLGNHPAPYHFVKMVLSSDRITSFRFEIENKQSKRYNNAAYIHESNNSNTMKQMVLEQLSKNTVLKRLIIKDLPSSDFHDFFQCLINNKHLSTYLKALGLSTSFNDTEPLSSVSYLDPLLQLPGISTLYCSINDLLIYLEHISRFNRNIRILKTFNFY